MNPTDTLPTPLPRSWQHSLSLLLPAGLCLLLAACGTPSGIPGAGPSGDPKGSLSDGLTGRGPGGYPVGAGDYRNDGPHANPPDLSRIPDAVPRIETLATGANRPYEINGTRYVPDVAGSAYRARGRASWYGRQFHGRPTSNGEIYDMYAMTAAHPTLPIPSYARVSRADGSRQVIVRINDRGPFHSSRIIDLSYAAAHRLDTLQHGTAEVIVERIMPEEIYRAGDSSPAVAIPVVASTTTSFQTSAWNTAINGSRPAPAATPAPTASPAPVAVARPVPAANPVPPPRPAPAANAVASGQVYLQLGAFSDLSRAQALAAQLNPTLSDIGQIQLHRPADQLYRVRLGPLEHNRARQLVATVQQRSGIKAHVTPP